MSDTSRWARDVPRWSSCGIAAERNAVDFAMIEALGIGK
jgi:hypothetical protein